MKPILPSGLVEERTSTDAGFSSKVFGNSALKMGVVLEILEKGSDDNRLNLGPEYHVMAIEQDKANGINTSIYKNCLAFDSFGGIADYFQFKRRVPKDKKKVQDKGSSKNQTGTIVLLLCLDKNAEKAVILGQLGHPDKDTILTEEKGHHAEGEFNGVNWEVNKDGEFTITFNSATDGEGTPSNDTAGGTFIKMDKDGSLEFSDGETESIKIDKTSNKIDVKAKGDVSVTSQANINLTAKQNFNLKCEQLVAEAQGQAIIKIGGITNIESKGIVNIKAPALVLNADGGAVMNTGPIEINSPRIKLGKGGSPALIFNTLYLGIGNLGAPVISAAIGPFSSIVFIK